MTDTEDDPRYRAPALDKGLDILELLSRQPNGMTRAEIVKAMGRGPSEIYRMLERLVRRDYISRSIGGNHYQLTMKLFLLGSQHPPISRLVAEAMPRMDQFAHTTQQSVHLVVPDRGEAIVIAQASTPDNWEFAVRIGARLNLLRTGSGRTLLAFQSQEKRMELLNFIEADKTASEQEWKSIEESLDHTYSEGHRVENSIQMADIVDISVPIIAQDKFAVGVLTCPYIRRLDRSEGADTETTLAALHEVADALSMK